MLTLIFSLLCGTIVGLERRMKGKAAGIKTLSLIAMGSTMFTLISLSLPGDKSRMLSNIITGIGFLGAGCVFRDTKDHVNGLTTAATIWVVAALGIMCGMGLEGIALFLSVFITLWLLVASKIENWLFPYGEADARLSESKSAEPALKNNS